MNYQKNDKVIITAPVFKDCGKIVYIQARNENGHWIVTEKPDYDVPYGYFGSSQLCLVNNGTGFKSHMILFGDQDNGFTTMCGIGDDCSESFYENAELFDYGDFSKVNCKKCLLAYRRDFLEKKEVESIDRILKKEDEIP